MINRLEGRRRDECGYRTETLQIMERSNLRFLTGFTHDESSKMFYIDG